MVADHVTDRVFEGWHGIRVDPFFLIEIIDGAGHFGAEEFTFGVGPLVADGAGDVEGSGAKLASCPKNFTNCVKFCNFAYGHR